MRAGAIARFGPWLLAVASGLVWAACHGRVTLPLASWLGLAPLVVLLAHRRAWALGWLHGVVAWLAAISWIRPTLETYGGLPGWLSAGLLFLLCLYLGAYHGLFALLGGRLWRRGGAFALLGLPALWVALEWLRAHLLSGFPWNLAAYAWTEVPGALPIAAWIGAYGVSFLLVCANVGATMAIVGAAGGPGAPGESPAVGGAPVQQAAVPSATEKSAIETKTGPGTARRAGVAAALACLALLAIGARWGAGPAAPGAAEPAELGAAAPVRLLQPNTENLVTWDAERARQGYERIFELSYRACDEAGALLVWPESAAWPHAWGSSPLLRQDLQDLAARGCPVLFNSTDERAEGYYNSVLLLDRTGVVGRYDKRHLVPFGEYVPLADVFFFLDKIARNAGSYVAGREVALLDWGAERLGAAVCFEVVFPAEVAELARAGATILVTVTNDAWYGDTSAPWQHFRAVRFRAAETRRPFVRAAVTGISAVIGPDGSVSQLLGVGEEGTLAARVRGRAGLSLYARRPSLVPASASLVALFAIFLARRRPR